MTVLSRRSLLCGVGTLGLTACGQTRVDVNVTQHIPPPEGYLSESQIHNLAKRIGPRTMTRASFQRVRVDAIERMLGGSLRIRNIRCYEFRHQGQLMVDCTSIRRLDNIAYRYGWYAPVMEFTYYPQARVFGISAPVFMDAGLYRRNRRY
ncbi:MAG: hypothetical protein ACI9H6_000208 [Patiriisocius sp.]|jgi:hypothetical protein